MVRLGQEWIGAHAAIGMALAKVFRSIDGSSRRRLRQGPLVGLQGWFEVQGQRYLTGGGMVPFPLAIETPGLLHNRRGGEPVGQLTAQPRRHRQAAGGGSALGLGKGGPGGGDVAAVAVDHINPLESVARQRKNQVMEHCQQGGGLKAHGAGEAQMVLGHAKGLGGGHQHAGAASHRQGHGLGGEGIGADGAGGAVLFGGAQGHDHPLAPLQIGLNLGPGAQLQADGLGPQGRGLGTEGEIGGGHLGHGIGRRSA